MAMNYYSYLLTFSYFLLGTKKKLQKGLQRQRGLCFIYVFCLIIISSVLYQCPKSLVPEVMVSGMHLLQNPSFVVLLFSTAVDYLTLTLRQMSSLPSALSSMPKTIL